MQSKTENIFANSKILLKLALMFIISSNIVAQNTSSYDKLYEFDTYKKGWALIMEDGKLGFINKKGKEIVAPIYDDISEFNTYKKGWALIKKDGKLGFINTKGKEIVAPIVAPMIAAKIVVFVRLMIIARAYSVDPLKNLPYLFLCC